STTTWPTATRQGRPTAKRPCTRQTRSAPASRGCTACRRWARTRRRLPPSAAAASRRAGRLMSGCSPSSTTLTATPSATPSRSPVFTPDSRLVAFASNREADVFQVYTVDLRGSAVTRLTQDDSDYQALDNQPDPLLRLARN